MEQQKQSMQLRQFRIGDLANELRVKKFVIRFWEQEFNLAPDRSEGNHRFYTTEDLRIFSTIKDLLYNQGYTIEGAKKQLPLALAVTKRGNDEFMHDNTPVVSEIISLAPQALDAAPTQTDTVEQSMCKLWSEVPQLPPASTDASSLAAAQRDQTSDIVPAHEAEVEYHLSISTKSCSPCEQRKTTLDMIKAGLERLRDQFAS